jgi:hypothetical protein
VDKLGLQAQQRMLSSFIFLLPSQFFDDLSGHIYIRTKVIADAFQFLKIHNFFSYVFSIGDYVTMGGRVAVRDHVSIASKV